MDKADIDKLISEKGGYSKAVLASLGVSWPPPKGWKKALINGTPQPKAKRKKARRKDAQGKSSKAGFYSSWDWKKARYEAIKKFEQRCMCCGWQPGDTDRGYLVVDHIKPRRKYPELELDLNNLQVLCNDCNMGKSNDSEDDWRSMDEQFKATIT